MATVITSAAICPPASVSEASSIAYAATAADVCLEQAGLGATDVDVLINVGVYRDCNIVEPSVAALIQKRIGVNPDYLRTSGQQPAFSFDLMNGACGILNAVQTAGALLTTGSARRVLVVSGDIHPSTDPAQSGTAAFPYASTGGALLLEHTADARGFERVHHQQSAGAPGVRGYLPLAQAGAAGRSTIAVDRDDDAVDRMVDFGADAAWRCLADQGAGSRGTARLSRTLLITSQPSPDFPGRLAQRLGLAEDAVVTVDGVRGDPHTSALVHGFVAVQQGGRLDRYDRILFLTVGAGLSSAAALYQLPGQHKGSTR